MQFLLGNGLLSSMSEAHDKTQGHGGFLYTRNLTSSGATLVRESSVGSMGGVTHGVLNNKKN